MVIDAILSQVPSAGTGIIAEAMPARRPLTPQQATERLEAIYGRHEPLPRLAPVDELVACMLSQHTADILSLPAFRNLVLTFGSWDAVADAPVEAVRAAIERAGLANQKSKAIWAALRMLRERFGAITLEPLRGMPTDEALKVLTALPGVGLKTASLVMCFTLDHPTPPIDTHVHRVATRLGLIPDRTTADRAHGLLRSALPRGYAYRFHVALLAHGRAVCRAPKPRCEACGIREWCPYGRAQRQRPKELQVAPV